MASDRQIAANRLNSKKSTGPRTDQGKRSSRRNAIRHGLTAETIIDVVEDPADYEAFEEAIKHGYAPRTGVECELLARLASLLWRLRRATAIESGLLKIQVKDSHDSNVRPHLTTAITSEKLRVFYDLLPPINASKIAPSAVDRKGGRDDPSHGLQLNRRPSGRARMDLVRSFRRLASLNDGVFDRLGRYETRLWRQTTQTIVLLNLLKQRGKFVRRYAGRFRSSQFQRSRFFPESFYR